MCTVGKCLKRVQRERLINYIWKDNVFYRYLFKAAIATSKSNIWKWLWKICDENALFWSEIGPGLKKIRWHIHVENSKEYLPHLRVKGLTKKRFLTAERNSFHVYRQNIRQSTNEQKKGITSVISMDGNYYIR